MVIDFSGSTGSIRRRLNASWSDDGYEVVFIPMRDDRASGEYGCFLTDLVTKDGVLGRSVGNDGFLFVTDDGSHSVWRATWASKIPIIRRSPDDREASEAPLRQTAPIHLKIRNATHVCQVQAIERTRMTEIRACSPKSTWHLKMIEPRGIGPRAHSRSSWLR